MDPADNIIYDVIIIGGGQSALSAAYYLRRTDLRYLLLDSEVHPGGAWQHTWESLSLFSPAQWSSLPGVPVRINTTGTRATAIGGLWLLGYAPGPVLLLPH